MNFVAIPRNASRSISRALGIQHTHKSVKLVGCPAWAVIREPADRLASWWKYHKNISPVYGNNFAEWVSRGYPHHWRHELEMFKVNNPLNQWEFIEIGGELKCELVPFDDINRRMTLKRVGRTQGFQMPGILRQKINGDFKIDYKYYVLAKQRGTLHPEYFKKQDW